ncbi:MAG: type IV secretory system conjugative DNA transfer family protein [Alphaproteobacteria bacterium]|nr:type IV secretory system conjugative DNA transfer family protein [Alphaproteobacteria bacterium]
MMIHERNEHYRYGSAAFAERRELADAGFFRQTPTSLFVGFFDGQPLWYHGAGGLLLTAGARSGKLRDILAYNLCSGTFSGGSLLALDMKGELAAISQDQTPDQKFCAYWNPLGLHGLPRNRLNPVSYIRQGSNTLVSDVKVFTENMIPLSGSANAQYFEMRARDILEGTILTLVEKHGTLTLPDLYHAVNLIPGAGEEWLDFAYLMHTSAFPVAVRVEEEINRSRKDNAGGFQGILGEVFKALSCLSDPVLMGSVSPPYDFDMDALTDLQQRWQVYLMPPAEFVDAWAPVIKAIFVSAMIYKSRAPSAPQQTWILDECAQLNNFPLVVKLFTYGAGIGIRPWAVFQSTEQMNALGPNAKTIITSSAALQIYFALREIGSAKDVSTMLGTQTLEFNDTLQQGQSRLAKSRILQSLLTGEDPLGAGIAFGHYKQAEHHRSKQMRPLQTPDEVLNARPDAAFIFADALQHPVFAQRQPYYQQSFMAGRFHPNPYHPPADKVRVTLGFGRTRWLSVKRESVPHRFAHYPQYVGGEWSVLR